MTDITLEQRAAFDSWWHKKSPELVSGDWDDDRAIAQAAWEAALRLPAGEGWVSVNERLPGAHEHVEVWPDPRDDTYSFYAHSDGGTNGVKAGNWYYNDRHGDDYVIRVTHWRTETAAPRHEPGEGS